VAWKVKGPPSIFFISLKIGLGCHDLINLDSFLRQFCQEKRSAVMVQVKGEFFFRTNMWLDGYEGSGIPGSIEFKIQV
jgi:hypothetical protein